MSTKAKLDDVVSQLRRRGLAVTQTELVEFALDDLTKHESVDIDALDRKIREWRAGDGRSRGDHD